MAKRPVILNQAGKPIVLNAQEQRIANYNQRIANDLGYQIDITTLTTISKKVVEQKFFEIAPADYLPVRVGEGTWGTSITTYRDFSVGGEFEKGIINLGGQNARLASADAAVDSLTVKIFPWANELTWTIFEMQEASRSGNWDVVESKERARKKNWDLGIQRIAFLGARGLNTAAGGCLGLLNQPSVNVNTTTITKAISTMTTAELKTFTAKVVDDYRSNNQRSAFPSAFIVPESDYNGMAATVSPDFPIKSILQLLEEMFATSARRKDFKILPLAYADAAYHSDVTAIAGKQVYTLLNYDEDSVRMDIPLDYTNTQQNTLNSFQFQNVGFGQFTGALAYRPLEMLYFQY